MTLNPGAINYGLKSANTSTSNGNTFTVAGRRPSDNIVLLNGIEYTGSSQLAHTPGGVSGELLGIDAVREFNVLTDTYSRRIRQALRSAGQRRHPVGHQRTARFALRIPAQQRSRCAQFLRPGLRSRLSAAISSAARWAARSRRTSSSSSAITKASVRLLARQQRERGARRAGAPGNAAQRRRRLHPVANLNPAMLKYFALWPAGQRPGAAVERTPSGTALSYNNPRQSIREDFGTTARRLHHPRQDTLSAAYTIDDGNSLIPRPIRCSRPTRRCAARWPACRKPTSSRRRCSIRSASASRAPASISIRRCWRPFPSNLSFVTGNGDPAASSSAAASPPPALAGHHLGGPEQRGQRLEPPKSVHLCGRRSDHQRHPPDQRRRVVSARAG